ncbi:MAG: putative Fe-S cluster assembly protein SufT [Nitrococcus sp.]|nr:putative Fe-S cluster assembly protein SufT [Nitrococcus sp.]
MASESDTAVTFLRDCEVALVPSGETGIIPKGSEGAITQALGGSYTINLWANLFRVDGSNADAIGREPDPPPTLPDLATDEDVEKTIWEQLQLCYDPEIPVNVVELGLVYECDIQKLAEDRRRVHIRMTLTAPSCGMGDILAYDVKTKVSRVPTVADAEIEIVLDPPWTQDMMSEAAQLETGMI